MTIRYATPEDLLQIKALWDISFPEEPIFNAWFFNEIYQNKNTLLYCLGDEVCAMLQMFPYELKMSGNIFPVHYIYGACTHPSHRKNGFMKQLLQHACQEGTLRGDVASVLIPQEEWFFSLYGKYGYRPAFFIRKINFVPQGDRHHLQITEVRNEDIEQMAQLYAEGTKTNKCIIFRTKEQWKQQIKMFQTIGAGGYCLKQNGQFLAYGFAWNLDDKLLFQEGFGVNDEALATLGEQVAIKKNTNCMTLMTSFSGKGKRIPLGCIKFLKEELSEDFIGYMNLMFN